MNGNGHAKKPDVGTWVRWAGGLVVLLVGMLWSVSVLFAERPTEKHVKEMISDSHSQHPDSREAIGRNAAELQAQKLQLVRIGDGVETIKETVKEIKDDIKASKGGRR